MDPEPAYQIMIQMQIHVPSLRLARTLNRSRMLPVRALA